MKLTTILMLVCCLQISAESVSQTVTLKVKNAPLTKVFNEIKKQTGYTFIYTESLLKESKRINLTVNNEPLDKVLNICFSGQPFSYRIINKTIVVEIAETEIVPAESLSITPVLPPTPLLIEIKGRVTDEEGNPLAGVSVSLKGNSSVGTTTNENGEYSLDVSGNVTLIFSFVGYESREFKTNGRTTVNVELQSSVSSMEDVVVTGYTTVRKKMFSGASSTLSAKDVERPGMPDMTKMLEGQFAGVSVQNISGTFGAAPKLRIRGATSLSGDNKPLWVIDGVVVEDVVNISNEALSTGDMNTLLGSSVAGINPEDIQDITILRDAAATALYGARAMNGVVVVTTKKGSASQGKLHINYSGNYSTYLKPSYREFDVLNSADQMAVMVELENKGYYQMPGMLNGADGGIFNKMYNEIYNYDSSTKTFALRNDTKSKNEFLERYANANTDWFDIIFKNSLVQEHGLSLTSGTDNFQTYASTSYMKDDGQTIGNNVERFTGNFKSNFKVGKRFSGELITNGSVRNQRAPGTQNQQSEPVYGTYLRGFDINPYNYAMNTSRMVTVYDENGDFEYFRKNFAPFNIINELNSNYIKMNQIDFKVQGKVDFKIFSGLTYSAIGSYRFVKNEAQTYILEESNMALAYKAAQDPTSIGSNQYLYDNPDDAYGYPMVILPSGGFYNVNMDNFKSFYFRQELKYDKTFGDHAIIGYASMETRSAERQSEFFDGVGYQFENGGLVNPYYMYFKKQGEAGKPYFGMLPGVDRFRAYMGQVTYGYQDKYVITPTVRFDGSNKMGASKTARWLPTWNIAGSWNVDRENFFPKNKYLTSLSLRGSYGLVGNIGAATNSSAVFYNMIARRPYLNDQETLTYLSSLENSQLTWEKSRDLNVGIELGFLYNRINLVMDIYKRNIGDLLGNIETSGIGGESEKYGNYASMKGHGVEFTLNGYIIQKKNFTWSSRLNLAFNKNKITKLEVDPSIWRSVSPNGAPVKGYPQRGLFAVEFTNLDHNFGYPMYIGTTEEKDATTYINLQGNDIDNLVYIGNIDPITTGGFYNTFRFKEFTLTGLIKFSYGNYLRLSPRFAASYSDMSSMTRDMLNRWMMPNDENFTSVPALIDNVTAQQIVDYTGAQVSSVYPYNLYNYSDQRIAKGDYIKLSSVSLGYSLPKRITDRLGMSLAQLVLVTNDIWIIYADKRLNGQDPEFFASGGVALPTAKRITLALKLGL